MGNRMGPGRSKMDGRGLEEKARPILGIISAEDLRRGQRDWSLTWTPEAKQAFVICLVFPSLRRADSWAERKERSLREARSGTHALSCACARTHMPNLHRGDTLPATLRAMPGKEPGLCPATPHPVSLLTTMAVLLPEYRWPTSCPCLRGRPLGLASLDCSLRFHLL